MKLLLETIAYRRISQERLSLNVGFFQFIHKVCQRGKSLLRALVETFVIVNPEKK